VREGLARLLAEAVIEGAPPLALAGFAFDPQQPQEKRWLSFPDGLAVLPRLLFARRNGSCSLMLNALVHAETNVGALEAALQGELEGVLATTPDVSDAEAHVCADSNAKATWLANVADLTDRIGAGEADKVVLARRRGRTHAVRADAAFRRAALPGDDGFCSATAMPLPAPRRDPRARRRNVRADCLAGSPSRCQRGPGLARAAS
jgi:isochorismate synthase EntC